MPDRLPVRCKGSREGYLPIRGIPDLLPAAPLSMTDFP